MSHGEGQRQTAWFRFGDKLESAQLALGRRRCQVRDRWNAMIFPSNRRLLGSLNEEFSLTENSQPDAAPNKRQPCFHPPYPPRLTSMSEHRASICWTRNGPDFGKGQYSREHTWGFDGGMTIAASPTPSVVPAPWSNAANVDPEEAFVASVASCHMLTFLWLASKAGFVVDDYRDEAVGTMTRNERRISWISLVTLRPAIRWSGEKRPTAEDLARLHHDAHEQCFIANSVKSEIVVQAQD